ncbi:SDR family NAD(P)-dependent oxidoreductase [Poseidonibacter ostreae]|jgi:NAD(P)-dependent dehydrogenase (short-subunit alcohol dehydrogenase family)|uniref:SDR family NAD(P)-dependent oxidoreductase n=1 Tax=Poseidonibacter ostreae TaxID=2654171 RepID=A0A6L4WTR5_9BACT|nr:SDR family NAD(P)-dependent oxidoreductase [Poseidonibacter ostreae]KAB7885893.1 SDR family NAD(P)-dependent oxidoreductase [Poseidonibacter ostreae]KAB7889370.1 SDR family NAD(P)-dependent oxidoreductase [Poseidonibacter ostreae]KAB7891646.1 SDR family NAD(P)-dependent oxidoreductase [Poseidonibacter ostreae]
MQKTILITGSTDGIGLLTAQKLLDLGHKVLIHGRNSSKLEHSKQRLLESNKEGIIETYLADLSNISEVKKLASDISKNNNKIDVLINNAGIYKTNDKVTKDGLDVRFVVNTIAPYLLTKALMPLLHSSSRVVNLSSAAQAPVQEEALRGEILLEDSHAYAQSKLALTMWSSYLAFKNEIEGLVMVAVNPKSFLGSKMVKDAYGAQGVDINIGADILVRASLSDEFSNANGKYFDNDIEQFALPHLDATDIDKCKNIVLAIEEILKRDKIF